jgi:hypothetical protein
MFVSALEITLSTAIEFEPAARGVSLHSPVALARVHAVVALTWPLASALAVLESAGSGRR